MPQSTWTVDAIPNGVTDVHTALMISDGIDHEICLALVEYGDRPRFETWAEANRALVFLHPNWQMPSGSSYCTATVRRAGIQLLQAANAAGIIQRFELSIPSSIGRVSDMPSLDFGEGKHVVAPTDAKVLHLVIDDGCPFAHPGMRTKSNKSRLAQFWVQAGSLGQMASQSPKSWGFGACADTTAINAYLTVKSSSSQNEIYEATGQHHLKQRFSHGAHVLGSFLDAASSVSIVQSAARAGKTNAIHTRPATNLPEKPDCVFVQLPSVYRHGGARHGLASHRLAAMRFALDCATNGATESIILPLASEIYDGSHDAGSLVECAMEALVRYAKVDRNIDFQILAAAGNAQRMQTSVSLEVNNIGVSYFLKYKLPPDLERESFAEVWLPKNLVDSQVLIRAPNGTDSAILATDQIQTLNYGGNIACSILRLKQHRNQICYLIRFAPTQQQFGGLATAPSGYWSITVNPPTGVDGKIDLYVARLFPGIGGHYRGAQPHFVAVQGESADAQSRRTATAFTQGENSISGLACGRGLVGVVGAYQLSGLKLRSKYSSLGPARVGSPVTGVNVPYGAPGDESFMLPGISGWGNAGGMALRMAGTSVATPLAAYVLSSKSLISTLPSPVTAIGSTVGSGTASGIDPRIDGPW